jgi:hypothetical protein
MLRNHRLVGKAFRHDRGGEMTGTPLVTGVARMQVRIVLDVEFERIQSA